jgi:hypothetical protein
VSASEEVRHGLGEVPQSLLLHHLAASGQPSERDAGLGQLRCLRAVPRRALAPGTPPQLLLDGEVPHEPGVRAMLSQDPLLGGGNNQAVAGHTSKLSNHTDIYGGGEAAFPHPPEAGVSTPQP